MIRVGINGGYMLVSYMSDSCTNDMCIRNENIVMREKGFFNKFQIRSLNIETNKK